MEYAKSNLALAQNIQVSRADHTPKCDRDDSQHPFGNPATATDCEFQRNRRIRAALGFASQPCDWFAFSRMMTLAGPLTRNFASAHVGQASHLTVDEWCQAKSLTYGAEEEFHAARDLAITRPGANVITRHASTPQTYVNSVRSQTADLRQFGKIPQGWNGVTRFQNNRYNRARNRRNQKQSEL
jgi:hypothetical protein